MSGSGTDRVEVRSGSYHDSVTLMQVSRAVAGVEGVLAAQVSMATDLNLEVLHGMGFAVPPGLGAADLVVAVRAVDDTAHEAALAAVAAGLMPARPAPGVCGEADGSAVPHRTVGAAARAVGAGLALISVPGPHAFTEAMDALDAGCDVMVFSDNVPVEQEIRLKDAAAERGRFVMGPDCGTAVIGGVGLGFANVVRPGPLALVAASGTGAQQVLSLLDGGGGGVRHCLGVGGRDLSAAVAGRSTRAALALLDDDPDVGLILVVSKPPAAEVAASVEDYARTLSTPVRFALLGPGREDLTAVVRAAAEEAGATWRRLPRWFPPTEPTGSFTRLRGAFAGGTLCDEAMIVASAVLGPIASNTPLPGAPRLAADLCVLEDTGERPAYAMVDFGDDELTRGRPHPMIDGALRTEWLAREARAVERGDGVVVLVDLVLGLVAHPDPAAELAPAIMAARASAAARGGALAVVVSLCGTGGDPQGLRRQAEALARAGASVHLSNAEATRFALGLLTVPARCDRSTP